MNKKLLSIAYMALTLCMFSTPSAADASLINSNTFESTDPLSSFMSKIANSCPSILGCTDIKELLSRVLDSLPCPYLNPEMLFFLCVSPNGTIEIEGQSPLTSEYLAYLRTIAQDFLQGNNPAKSKIISFDAPTLPITSVILSPLLSTARPQDCEKHLTHPLNEPCGE